MQPAKPQDRSPFPVSATVHPYVGLAAPTKIPNEGDVVIGSLSGAVSLTAKIAAGGEGTIFRTDRVGVVCKIYLAEHRTLAKYEKLKLMTSREVCINGLSWPTELVSNSAGDFVGYLMPMATGKTLRVGVWGKKQLLLHHPDWTRRSLTTLCVTICSLLKELHALNVLVGDINPMNFLVEDPGTVHLVDCDSF